MDRISPVRNSNTFYSSDTAGMFEKLKARYTNPTPNKSVTVEMGTTHTDVHVESFESRARRPESPAARSMFRSNSRSGLVEISTSRPNSVAVGMATHTVVQQPGYDIQISQSPPAGFAQRIISAERRLTDLEDGLRTASQLPVRLSSVVRDLEHRMTQSDSERRNSTIALEDASRELASRVRDLEARLERKDLEVRDIVHQAKKTSESSELKFREIMQLLENTLADLTSTAHRTDALEHRAATNEVKSESTKQDLISKISTTASDIRLELNVTREDLEGAINELTASTKQSFEDVTQVVDALQKRDDKIAHDLDAQVSRHDSLVRRHDETVADLRAASARLADLRDAHSDLHTRVEALGEDLNNQIATQASEQRLALEDLRDYTTKAVAETAANAAADTEAAMAAAAEATAALEETTKQSFQDVHGVVTGLQARDDDLAAAHESLVAKHDGLSRRHDETVADLSSLTRRVGDVRDDLADTQVRMKTMGDDIKAKIEEEAHVATEKIRALRTETLKHVDELNRTCQSHADAISELSQTTRQSFQDVADTVEALRNRDEELSADVRTLSTRIQNESEARKAEIRTAVADSSARNDLNLAEVRRNLRENVVQECNTLSLAIRDLASGTDERLARISDRVSAVAAAASAPSKLTCAANIGPSIQCQEQLDKVRSLTIAVSNLEAKQDKTANQLTHYLENSLGDVKRAFERTQARQMEQMEAVNGVLDLVASEVDSLKAAQPTTSISIRSPPRFTSLGGGSSINIRTQKMMSPLGASGATSLF